MKRFTVIASMFLLATTLPTLTKAQSAAKDFFNNSASTSVYLGIDFTKARIINDPTANPQAFVDRYFSSINELTATEYKKYDIREVFKKNFVDHDFTGVDARNAKINASEVISSNSADAMRLKPADIAEVVNHFNYNGKTGVGILFIMEGMDKPDKSVTVWVTLIDIATKNIILTERVQARTGSGFGERNYWASGIKNVLEEIKKGKYAQWKQNYGNK
jgi:hypothetical protein